MKMVRAFLKSAFVIFCLLRQGRPIGILGQVLGALLVIKTHVCVRPSTRYRIIVLAVPVPGAMCVLVLGPCLFSHPTGLSVVTSHSRTRLA